MIYFFYVFTVILNFLKKVSKWLWTQIPAKSLTNLGLKLKTKLKLSLCCNFTALFNLNLNSNLNFEAKLETPESLPPWYKYKAVFKEVIKDDQSMWVLMVLFYSLFIIDWVAMVQDSPGSWMFKIGLFFIAQLLFLGGGLFQKQHNTYLKRKSKFFDVVVVLGVELILLNGLIYELHVNQATFKFWLIQNLFLGGMIWFFREVAEDLFDRLQLWFENYSMERQTMLASHYWSGKIQKRLSETLGLANSTKPSPKKRL